MVLGHGPLLCSERGVAALQQQPDDDSQQLLLLRLGVTGGGWVGGCVGGWAGWWCEGGVRVVWATVCVCI
jgi:hypothetical protein